MVFELKSRKGEESCERSGEAHATGQGPGGSVGCHGKSRKNGWRAVTGPLGSPLEPPKWHPTCTGAHLQIFLYTYVNSILKTLTAFWCSKSNVFVMWPPPHMLPQKPRWLPIVCGEGQLLVPVTFGVWNSHLVYCNQLVHQAGGGEKHLGKSNQGQLIALWSESTGIISPSTLGIPLFCLT